MNLLEVIKNEFAEDIERGKTKFGYNDLKKIYYKLQNCDEFYECHLILNEMPYVPKTYGDIGVKMVNNHTLYEGNKYTGATYLNDISLTPTMYDPSEIGKEVLDGCSISPVMYKPENFTPYRRITLNYELEQTKLLDGRFQDILSENEMREKLHRRLDSLLDDNKKYEPKGIRRIMLRGVFNFTTPEKTKCVDYK
jgi:hypothetical protein